MVLEVVTVLAPASTSITEKRIVDFAEKPTEMEP